MGHTKKKKRRRTNDFNLPLQVRTPVHFTFADGTKIENVARHAVNILKEHPDSEIHIGTDSQVYGNEIKYATVIAFGFGRKDFETGHGVHYIKSKQRIWLPKPRKKGNEKPSQTDLRHYHWTRLYAEAELSVNTAKKFKRELFALLEEEFDVWLLERIDLNIHVDLDFSQEERWLSNMVLAAGEGLVKQSGFICNKKPDIQRIAAFAADKECK